MTVFNLVDAQKADLKRRFPGWRIGGAPGRWYAIRGGFQAAYGPGSLLRCYLGAPDLQRLAMKLSLQQFLDGLTADELAEVWRMATLAALEDADGAT
jgi:hypothetical protein